MSTAELIVNYFFKDHGTAGVNAAHSSVKGLAGAADGATPSLAKTETAVGKLATTLGSTLPVGGAQATSAINTLGSSILSHVGATSALQVASVGAAAAIGVVLVGALLSGISKFQTAAAEVRKLKAVTGETAEEASRLRNVAIALGVDTDTLAKGMFKLVTNLEMAKGELAGVHVEIARGKQGNVDYGATLDNMRAAYQSLEDPGAKNRFLLEAFKRTGMDLRAVLSSTNAEFERMKRIGPIFTDKDLKASRDLAISQRELGLAVDNVQISIARGAIPVLAQLSQAVVDAQEDMKRWDQNLPKVPDWLVHVFLPSTKQATKGTAELTAAEEHLKSATSALGVELSAEEEATGKLTDAHLKEIATVQGYSTALQTAYATTMGATDVLISSTDSLARKFYDARTAADVLKTGLDILTGVHVNATQAAIGFEARVDALSQSFVDNGTSLDITTEAGRKNMGAILDLITGTGQLIDAMSREGATNAEVTATYTDHIGQLRGVLETAGLTESQIQALIDKYHLVPPTVDTELTARDNATWTIQNVKGGLDSIHDKTVTVTVHERLLRSQFYGSGASSFYAEGGLVTTATLGLVGEAGPELILPLSDMARTFSLLNQAGLVQNFADPGRVGAAPSFAGGGVNVTVIVQGSVLADQELATTVRDELIRMAPRFGGSIFAGRA